jgi:hypothetical protein
MESLRYIGNQEPVRSVQTGMRALLAIASVAIFAAGCGSEAADENETPQSDQISNELVLEVEHLRGGPVIALYADGRLFTPAPQLAIYPAPALPGFNVARISPDRVQEILEEVRASGLLDSPPAPGAATVVTTTADGERHVALLRRDQAVALDNLLADLPVSNADKLYEPQALAVFVGPLPEPTEGIEPQVRDWPLAGALPGSGCVVVSGAELEPVLAAALRANQLTRWRSSGALVGLTFRPLLPHEGACEDVAAPSSTA